MDHQNFSITFTVDQSPEEVFQAVTNVRGWWTADIQGKTGEVNDEFTYRYKDVHISKIRLIAVEPGKKVTWLILDNYFNFTKDVTEWKDTHVEFEITSRGGKTELRFTHVGLVPEYECYNACVDGWTYYIQHSLFNLITTGKGQPNSGEAAFTTHEVAALFSDLARQEKWFEIQDQLFADNVRSIEPVNSLWLQNAEGKNNVRQKAENWVKRIETVHKANTSNAIISGNHFAVGREMDVVVKGHGRIKIDQVMLYEVENGRIISEQFFY